MLILPVKLLHFLLPGQESVGAVEYVWSIVRKGSAHKFAELRVLVCCFFSVFNLPSLGKA